MLNRTVGAALGVRIAEHFVEVLFAPGYDDDALEALSREAGAAHPVEHDHRPETPRASATTSACVGGLLVQDRDDGLEDARVDAARGRRGRRRSSGSDLLFAWRVCKHVSSNAIVLARGLQTIGIGAGQMSRVDAVRIAVEKARELGHDTAGAVLASDAFFPFADGPQLALDAGITAIIQPGGSNARRRGDRRRRRPPEPRWSSPADGTSGTDGRPGAPGAIVGARLRRGYLPACRPRNSPRIPRVSIPKVSATPRPFSP